MEKDIVILKRGEKTYYLIPTAHISAKSALTVEETINEVSPESVCIELDSERYDSIVQKKQWNEKSIFNVIKEKRVALLFVQILLSSYQKRLGENFNVDSGVEMLAAANIANERGLNLVLADRSIKVTFNRVWRNLTILEKLKLIYTLICGLFENEGTISEEELEALKTRDMVQSAMEDLSKEFPNVKRYLVDERDWFLSQKIKNAPGEKIVAVIGAAHLDGVVKNIENDYDVEELSKIIEKTPIQKFSGWILPIALLVLVFFTFKSDYALALEQIKQWVLYNGFFAGFFSLFAGANILSVLTAVVAAPITSLNPLLAAGWFAGLVEAYIIKPTVEDFSHLTDDVATFKGLFQNKITKVLMVVILANIGSTIGTVLGSYGIFKIFIHSF